MRRKLQNKSRKNKSKRSLRKRSTHRTRHIRGGDYDQETTKSLEGVPIGKTAMVAGDGFSMTAGEYKDKMAALDRDGPDY